MKKCVVCSSTIEKGQYCDAHLIAKKNLDERLKDWQLAYGKLTKKEYYERLINDYDIPVGEWAKEVAYYLLKKDKK